MANYDDTDSKAIIPVSQNERHLSLVGGGVLTVFGVAFGLARRNPIGAVLAALGGALLYRSINKRSPIYASPIYQPLVTSREKPSTAQLRGQLVTAVVTIEYPIEKLYDIWRDFQQVPRILSSIESVTVYDDTHSRWTTKPVGGFKVSWDTEIISEVPHQVIAWRALEDAHVANAGSVRFRPAPYRKGTEMRVTLEYAASGQELGVSVARWLGADPEHQLQDDLERFKAYIEQGRFEEGSDAWMRKDDGQFRAQDEQVYDPAAEQQRHDAENLNSNM